MKKITTLLLFLLLTSLIFAQAPNIQWQKAIGGTSYEEATSIANTIDGGYIIAGNTSSTNGDVTINHGLADYWVIKVDSNGIIEWQKTYGGTNTDSARSILQTIDGGYIVSGYTLSTDMDITSSHGSTDCWIVKLSVNGIIEWQKTYGGTGIDLANQIIQNSDGSYLVCGWTNSNNGDVTANNGSLDSWIIKLSNSGNIIWQKTLGGNDRDYARSIQKTSDGGYIFAGNSSSTSGGVTGNHGSDDCWIVKISNIGNIEWQKSFGGTNTDISYSIKQTVDGGYIVAGETLSSNGDVTGFKGLADCWVLKLSNIGDIQWQKTFGASAVEYAQDIEQTADGGYIMLGVSSSTTDGDVTGTHNDGDYWIVKLSNSGNIDWQKSLGGIGSDIAHSIKKTTDGGYIIAGTTNSNNDDVSGNHGDYDIWVLKLFPDTLNVYSVSKNSLNIYPNPAYTSITVQSENNQEIDKIIITDISGKMVHIQNYKSNTISIEKLPNGIYFIKAFTQEKSFISKFIKG